MNDTVCILLLYQHIHFAILVFLHRKHLDIQQGWSEHIDHRQDANSYINSSSDRPAFCSSCKVESRTVCSWHLWQVQDLTGVILNVFYHIDKFMISSYLKLINPFPSLDIIQRTIPNSFKAKYPSTRVIIDCTELFIQRSSSLINQSLTFSNITILLTF